MPDPYEDAFRRLMQQSQEAQQVGQTMGVRDAQYQRRLRDDAEHDDLTRSLRSTTYDAGNGRNYSVSGVGHPLSGIAQMALSRLVNDQQGNAPAPAPGGINYSVEGGPMQTFPTRSKPVQRFTAEDLGMGSNGQAPAAGTPNLISLFMDQQKKDLDRAAMSKDAQAQLDARKISSAPANDYEREKQAIDLSKAKAEAEAVAYQNKATLDEEKKREAARQSREGLTTKLTAGDYAGLDMTPEVGRMASRSLDTLGGDPNAAVGKAREYGEGKVRDLLAERDKLGIDSGGIHMLTPPQRRRLEEINRTLSQYSTQSQVPLAAQDMSASDYERRNMGSDLDNLVKKTKDFTTADTSYLSGDPGVADRSEITTLRDSLVQRLKDAGYDPTDATNAANEQIAAMVRAAMKDSFGEHSRLLAGDLGIQ